MAKRMARAPNRPIRTSTRQPFPCFRSNTFFHKKGNWKADREHGEGIFWDAQTETAYKQIYEMGKGGLHPFTIIPKPDSFNTRIFHTSQYPKTVFLILGKKIASTPKYKNRKPGPRSFPRNSNYCPLA